MVVGAAWPVIMVDIKESSPNQKGRLWAVPALPQGIHCPERGFEKRRTTERSDQFGDINWPDVVENLNENKGT
jgi:hypothetical protein